MTAAEELIRDLKLWACSPRVPTNAQVVMLEAIGRLSAPTEEQRIRAALRKLQFTNGDVSINGHSIGGHWNKHLQDFIDEVEAALSPLAPKKTIFNTPSPNIVEGHEPQHGESK